MSMNGGSVQPAPVPMQLSVGQAIGLDGQPFVILAITTPLGPLTFFLPPDAARALAADLAKVALFGQLHLPGNGPAAPV